MHARFILAVALLASMVVPGTASAAVIAYQTPAGSSSGGQPVDAKATFTTSANQVQVKLENLQADPRSVTQCLSGLQFTVSTGQSSGSLTSSSGVERTVASDGTFVDGSATAMGWSLSTVGGDLKLNLLGTPTAPDHTIIGPADGSNVYSNANSSITNGVHSPFAALSATFAMNVPGVTAASSISATTFQFNTSPGSTVIASVPEPAALSCLAVFGLAGLKRRQRA